MTTPTGTPAELFVASTQWLERQPLAANTRRTSRVQVAQFCAHLAARLRVHHDPGRGPFVVPASVRRGDDWLLRDPGRAEAAVAGGASTGFPFR
jgi:hypothetical protein